MAGLQQGADEDQGQEPHLSGRWVGVQEGAYSHPDGRRRQQ